METPQAADKLVVPSEIAAKPAKQTLWLVLGIAMVFVLGVGFGYSLLQNRLSPIFKQVKLQPTVVIVPSATMEPREIAKMTTASELLYVRDNNIFKYSLADKKETQLTSDGGDFISYKQLSVASNPFDYAQDYKERFSVERCVRQDREGKQPYSCAILLFSGTATPVELVKRSSKANVNGYHVGGEFGPFAVSSSAKLLAYVQTQEVDNTAATVEIHLYRLDNKNDEVLTAITTRLGGRGGSLDDEVSIHFSPDQTKIVVNLTTLYPQFGANDQGTMFILDLITKKLIWKQDKQWTTFGRFLDNQTVVAKQQPDNGGQASLVTISTTSGMVTKIGNFAGYAITPLNQSTILYFRDNSKSGKGMLLAQLDLTTNQTTVVKENVIPMGAVVAEAIAVRTMKPCTPENCGMDFYNGYQGMGVAILNLKNGMLTPLELTTVDWATLRAAE